MTAKNNTEARHHLNYMNNFIKCLIWWSLIGILLAACSTTTYYSRIENIDLTAKGEQYDISLQPKYMKYGLDSVSLRGFILTVMNYSDKDLLLIWKDTRFILNGEDKSGFVFPDTNPRFRHVPKRPSAVPSGRRLREEIFPVKFAFYQTVWNHRTLPEGELGVLLTLQVDGETITETLTLLHDTNIK